ncbi:hypothetical protein PoB_004456400 [Plakobranchus ocellatus]|uniref:Uncharacterized protein n=1 Tax=Plakobranchus ocellatus TaxID=259542 RepID=A0AAV4BIB2_9GAST|nr:hypothetical protein PoB_004456400 [Plakobranchus ocellatus]
MRGGSFGRRVDGVGANVNGLKIQEFQYRHDERYKISISRNYIGEYIQLDSMQWCWQEAVDKHAMKAIYIEEFDTNVEESGPGQTRPVDGQSGHP